MAKKVTAPKKAAAKVPAKAANVVAKKVAVKVTKGTTTKPYPDFWEGPPPTVKKGGKLNADSGDPKKSVKMPVTIYSDTWKPSTVKAGLYLDTWMPETAIKPNTSIYLDTWVPATILKKGQKPGMYADTWVPEGAIKLKQRKGK